MQPIRTLWHVRVTPPLCTAASAHTATSALLDRFARYVSAECEYFAHSAGCSIRVCTSDESAGYNRREALRTKGHGRARRGGVAPHAPQPRWEAARVAPSEGPEGVFLLPLG